MKKEELFEELSIKSVSVLTPISYTFSLVGIIISLCQAFMEL
jgi:hypothetical protein